MCQMTLEELNREDLIGIIRNAPTRSEYNAVCLALRQQTRRNKRALEFLRKLVDENDRPLFPFNCDDHMQNAIFEQTLYEAIAVLKE